MSSSLLEFRNYTCKRNARVFLHETFVDSSPRAPTASSSRTSQMIACRAFIRVGRAWKLSNTYFLSNKPLNFFQDCNHYHALSFSRNSMDRKKKHKMAGLSWRPLSSKSNLQEDVKIEAEDPYVEVSCNEQSEVGVEVKVVHSNAVDSEVQGLSKNIEMVNSLPDASSMREAVEEESSKFSADAEISSSNLMNDIGSHSVSVEVAASLFHFIKGKGGSTQKQIEEETGVKLIFSSSKESFIVIQGASVESVTKASNKIQVILEEVVKKKDLDYSHFISLPLAVHPELVDKLTDFQNSIMENSDSSKDGNTGCESEGDVFGDEVNDVQLDGLDVAVELKVDEREHVKVETNKIPIVSYPPKPSNSSNLSDLGIERSIFIKPKTFHLTVLMLKLWSKEHVARATEVLQRVSSKVLDALESKPVFVRLKGLECMRGSLAKAYVLYTPVEVIGGEDRLLHACQIITDAYVEAGLVLEKDARQKLKLHGTVMNARHRKRKKGKKRSDSFDARGIVKKYGSEEWGKYLIREAHLSQRFVYDENGYYHCCASIPFPDSNHVE